jgi:hypothetical protein
MPDHGNPTNQTSLKPLLDGGRRFALGSAPDFLDTYYYYYS